MKAPRNEREEHSALMRTPAMPVEPEQSRISEFVQVFRMYRSHGMFYAAKRAYGMAFRGLPF